MNCSTSWAETAQSSTGAGMSSARSDQDGTGMQHRTKRSQTASRGSASNDRVGLPPVIDAGLNGEEHDLSP